MTTRHTCCECCGPSHPIARTLRDLVRLMQETPRRETWLCLTRYLASPALLTVAAYGAVMARGLDHDDDGGAGFYPELRDAAFELAPELLAALVALDRVWSGVDDGGEWGELGQAIMERDEVLAINADALRLAPPDAWRAVIDAGEPMEPGISWWANVWCAMERDRLAAERSEGAWGVN